MIEFNIISLFPNQIKTFLDESIVLRAQKKGLIKIRYFNLRDFATDKHRTVDDKPYGGGTGMVLKVDIIDKALQEINKSSNLKPYIVLLTPQGKRFNQKIALKLSKKKRIVLICGHYEGFDERVRKLVDEQLSIGDFVLTGGEIPAAAIVDAVSRLIPGVISKNGAKNESFMLKKNGQSALEYPQYTRPEKHIPKSTAPDIARRSRGGRVKNKKVLKVPKILLSGNHKEIKKWRTDHLKSSN